MKTIPALALLLLALTPAAHAACRLTSDDERALAASPSGLTSEQFAGLAAEEQALVCSTRELAHEARASGGALQSAKKFSPRYLTAEEKKSVNEGLNALIERQLKSKGLAV
jgi:hypothetical protein